MTKTSTYEWAHQAPASGVRPVHGRERRAVVLCSRHEAIPQDDCDIAVLSPVAAALLEREGHRAGCLLDRPVTVDVPATARALDHALMQESHSNATFRWAPLAFLRVWRRLLHYRQFHGRLQGWLSESDASVVSVSSGTDTLLAQAARDVGGERGLSVTVGAGPTDPYLGLDPFLFAETIPLPGALDPRFLIWIRARCAGARGLRVLYDPYPNLGPTAPHTPPFHWWATVAARGRLRDIWTSPPRVWSTDALMAVDPPPAACQGSMLVDGAHWAGFSGAERRVIHQALIAFTLLYPNTYIDRLASALTGYLRVARPRRMVLLDTQVAHDRLLAFVARQAGVFVDYLPHGLITEHDCISTGGPFAPDRVLAWNGASASRYRDHGINATPISHPRNQWRPSIAARPSQSGPPKRVLVLMPSPEPLQLDTMERDALAIAQALSRTTVREVVWKLHRSHPAIAHARNQSVAALGRLLGAPMTLADPTEDTRDLMPLFDLVVIGRVTSAILEAAQLGLPFIIFRGDLGSVGALTGLSFAHEETADGLAKAIQTFDRERHENACHALARSLTGHPHPLDDVLTP